MSTNHWIHITVSGFVPERESSICAALDEVMKEYESGWDIGEAVTHVTAEGVPQIQCDSADPVIISAGHSWEDAFTKQVTDAVTAANGRSCRIDVETPEHETRTDAPRRPPLLR